MPVSAPRPDWCPETSNGQHSVSWYDGKECGICQQQGPAPDDYLWPGQSGPPFPAVYLTTKPRDTELELTWRGDDWTGRPYDPEDPGPEPSDFDIPYINDEIGGFT